MSNFAERLVAARAAKGLTQEALAKKIGKKNQSFISNLESGARNSTTFIPELANALGIDAYFLKTGKQPTSHCHANVAELPKRRPPLIEELLALTAKMSDTGIHRLIERATQLATEFPAVSQKRRL